MDKKKIVIISRTILPLQAPRAQRATELAKEFGRQGHDVTVYAVLGDYDYAQFELNHHVKVKNIGKMTFATLNSDGNFKFSFFSKLLSKLFYRLLEFPDIELSFKVYNILKKETDVDLLITVAVPYPIHWGAAYFKSKSPKNFPKTWVADCGDPYMGNEFNIPFFYFKYLEIWFCRKADYITVPLEEAKQGYYKEFHEKIKVIPQGFNFDEFQIPEKQHPNAKLTFIYAGAFYKGVRDPSQFLDYLSKINIDFKFIVYTRNKSILAPYQPILGDKIEVKDYISREALLQLMSQADFLVNFENGTAIQSPSKLIDYALAKRPILSIESLNLNEITVNQFFNEDYSGQLIVENIDQFNIINVANKFIQLSE